ncbi:MAG: Rne/Rng family ribonuclease, partial [Alphaproteobacteria bacterium]|nr:Rne/Rng family ribonuclease [Alphaproteobacteria bacterium]
GGWSGIMIDEILATSDDGQACIALRQEGRLVDLIVAGDGTPDEVGSIVSGRVTAVIKGMEAAFVDIGAERAGFLSLTPPRRDSAGEGAREGAAENATENAGENATENATENGSENGGEDEEQPDALLAPVNEGDEVLVQVTKSAQAGKGAGLSRAISLPGRYLVLTPRQARIAISRRIEDAGTREALAQMMADIARPGEGFILRTAARDAGAEALAADAEDLRRHWAEIQDRQSGASPPYILHGPSLGLAEVLRDHAHEGVRRVLVDNRRAEADAIAFFEAHLPESGARIEVWSEPDPMFEALGVEDEIDAALEIEVPLPCGGTLIIEETHALTAIDINTGRNLGRSSHADTVRTTNIEAAREIPRQLRLRGLGGITVIDFIHMEDPSHQDQVLDALMDGLKSDPAFIRATGISELGLVELTRRRGAGPLRDRLEVDDD